MIDDQLEVLLKNCMVTRLNRSGFTTMGVVPGILEDLDTRVRDDVLHDPCVAGRHEIVLLAPHHQDWQV